MIKKTPNEGRVITSAKIEPLRKILFDWTEPDLSEPVIKKIKITKE